MESAIKRKRTGLSRTEVQMLRCRSGLSPKDHNLNDRGTKKRAEVSAIGGHGVAGTFMVTQQKLRSRGTGEATAHLFQSNVEITTFLNICCEILRGSMQKTVFVSLVPLLEISLRRPCMVM